MEIGNNFYYKLLCDFRDRTDKEIQATRPDLVINDKREKGCQKIEVAIPGDCGARIKQNGKVEKYQDLATEVQKNMGSKDESCTVVVGTLSTVPLRLKGNLKHLGVHKSIILLSSRNWHCWVLQIY